MNGKISGSDLLVTRYIKFDTRKRILEGQNSALFLVGKKRFRFDQIDLVLYSADHQLTVTSGTEMLTVPIIANNAKHKAALDMLLTALRRGR
jgi:hypothetical protein